MPPTARSLWPEAFARRARRGARHAAAALALCVPAFAFAAVELNSADQAALEAVRGIGPELSAKLLAERRKALFKDWADVIRRVPGVGPGSAAKLSAAGLTVQGRPLTARSALNPPDAN